MPLALRPYQETGAAFLAAREGAILADAMGLGKTAQAASACVKTQALRVLWVAPAATLPGLVKELPRWGLPVPVVVRPDTDLGAPVLLLSVDSAERYADRLRDAPPWNVLVIDEAHTVKNPKAKRTKAILQKIRPRCARVWALTGTPMPSRPIELQPLLRHGLKQDWADYMPFGLRYCYNANRWSPRGFDFNGCTRAAAAELPKRLSKLMLRRTPEQVPGELPSIRRSTVPLDAPEVEYDFDRQALIDHFASSCTVPFADVSAYRKALGLGKIPAILSWCNSWLEDNEEKYLVVFGWHQDVLAAIAQGLETPYLATGHDNPLARQAMVDEWATAPKSRVFVASIGACGIGLNGLHRRASAAAFAEFPWGPAEIQQAEGRIRRIGGAASSVVSYFLVADDSLESHILEVVLEKADRQEKIIEGIV